jgi:hypothetical protein
VVVAAAPLLARIRALGTNSRVLEHLRMHP